MPATSIIHRIQADSHRSLARVTRAAVSRAVDHLLPGRGCCFTFHRVVAAADWASQPDRGFHLDVHYLETLIIHLRQAGWDIVTVEEAIQRVGKPGQRRFVNFSIDDCYRDTAELAVPLFRRLGVPVTLFVTTGIPDGTLRLRNAGLETILLNEEQVGGEDASFDLSTSDAKRHVFAALSQKWDGPHGDAAYERFCARNGYDPDRLDEQHRCTWPMLQSLRDDPLVEIGAHTVSHPRVSALSPEAAYDELVGCRARLEHVLDRPIRHFAFPFGRSTDCGPRDFAIARQAGFATAATTRKGLIGSDADLFQLPRNTLNGSHRKFRYVYAHLTGASGLATRILRRG